MMYPLKVHEGVVGGIFWPFGIRSLQIKSPRNATQHIVRTEQSTPKNVVYCSTCSLDALRRDGENYLKQCVVR